MNTYERRLLVKSFVICGEDWYTEPYTTARLICPSMNERQALRSMWRGVNRRLEYGLLKVHKIK